MRLALALAADDRFAMGAAALVSSAMRKTSAPIDFLLLDHGLAGDFVERLEAFVRSDTGGHTLRRHDVRELVARLPPPRDVSFSPAIYSRLVAPQLAAAPRLLYLDCDMVVRHDLAALWTEALGGRPFAAVQDLGVLRQVCHEAVRGGHADRAYFEAVLGGRSLESYFNSGLLLIDVEAFVHERIAEAAMAHLHAHPDLRHPDQDALNAVAGHRCRLLPDRWNVLASEFAFQADRNLLRAHRLRLRRALAEPAIFHYAHLKPWTWHPVPRRRWFYEALRFTPWAHWRPQQPASPADRAACRKAWRRHRFRLRIGPHRIDVRVAGKPVWQWRRPAAQATAAQLGSPSRPPD